LKTIVVIGSRFDKSATGACSYIALERMLLEGEADVELVGAYPELDNHAMSTQLAMFRAQFTYETVEHARAHLQTMCPEVCALFSQVEQLVRLLLVCPASSCTAERSFSALRRLKTWLRNSMTQVRLNCVAVCHVHQSMMDGMDLRALAEEFVGRSEIRRKLFGSFG